MKILVKILNFLVETFNTVVSFAIYYSKSIIKIIRLLLIGCVLSIFIITTLYKINEIDFKLAEIHELERTIVYYQRNIHKEILNAIRNDIALTDSIIKTVISLENFKLDVEEQRLTDNLKTYSIISQLTTVLDDLKPYINTQSSEIEQRIVDSVYFVYNDTDSSQGSGVLVKYHNNLYVFSVGHMINNNSDEIYLQEGKRKLAQLTPIIDDDKLDFALFKIDDPEFVAKSYVELAETWENKEEIYICGNPVGIEDMFSEGRIIKERDNYIYFYDHVYYGSSGGGIFNKKGHLIGNISHMRLVGMDDFAPAFMIHGATCLEKIKCLLKEKGL